MKKFAIVLMLFFTTNTSIGMEKETEVINSEDQSSANLPSKKIIDMGFVSLENRLYPYPTEIECRITNLEDNIRNIQILRGTKVTLGKIALIKKIEVSNDIPQSYTPGSGKFNPPVLLANYLKTWDNITELLLEKTQGYQNDNFVINVTWKHPFEWNKLQSYYSREWDYAFELIVNL